MRELYIIYTIHTHINLRIFLLCLIIAYKNININFPLLEKRLKIWRNFIK